ncbi:MAG TPA: hypothetical protein VLY46_12140 [Usitatibacter sp.]|nr:hypothetical protein [Usitatibacter sp.]
MTTRRRFLQIGLAGAAALLAVDALERAFTVAGRGLGGTLAADDLRVARALAPVVLAGALPSGAPEREAALGRIVAGFARVVARLGPAERRQLTRLLGLLRWPPARLLLAGLWRPLEEAQERDIAVFLQRWRASPFDLLRAAYAALTQLLQAACYDDPESWARIGYPGPPVLDGGPVR